MEESLRVLLQQPEWEGDMILATQIRCHLVTQQISEYSIQQALRNQESRIPVLFQESLAAQLTDIWRTVPPSVARHGTFLLDHLLILPLPLLVFLSPRVLPKSSACYGLFADQYQPAEGVLFHLYGAEVNVQELAMSFDSTLSMGDTMKQLDALQKCLNAVESWFKVWEAVPLDRWIGLTFNVFIQKIQSIVALLRLSTIDHIPAWNTSEVRKRMDIFALLERIAVQMDLAATAIAVVEDDPGEDSSKS